MRFRLIIPIAILCGLFLIAAPSVYAAVTLLPPCIRTGGCSVAQMMGTITNAAQLLLGVVGSFVLLIFIYGGLVWLTSAGDSDKIKSGMNIIKQTVIGLIIVFGAYVGIHFLTEALGVSKSFLPF